MGLAVIAVQWLRKCSLPVGRGVAVRLEHLLEGERVLRHLDPFVVVPSEEGYCPLSMLWRLGMQTGELQ